MASPFGAAAWVTPGVPVVLPGAAYRKSWFADKLDEYSGAGVFRRLLRVLAPDEFARLADPAPGRCFLALLRHIHKNLFPLHSYIRAEIEDAENWEPHDLNGFAENWAQAGIPYDARGLNLYEEPIESPAVALCVEMNPDGEEYEHAFLGPYRVELRHWIREVKTLAPFQLNGMRPPNGRAWLKPWDAVTVLYTWSCGQAGNPFFDVWPGIWDQDMDTMSPWNLGEIKSLAHAWEYAEPEWRRMQDLIAYVDASPRERLPLLAGAIRGDRETLRRISVPTGKRTTLAEVLK